MSLRFTLRPAAAVLAATIAAALSGCATGGNFGKTNSAVAAALAAGQFGGMVHGGNQPIYQASVKLWAAGAPTTGGAYGTSATLVAGPVLTDINGSFTFDTAGVSPCNTALTQGQYLYITAAGGNTGAGAVNSSSALMAAIPTPCGVNTGATFVWINEVTTVAAVSALQQFMSITPGGPTPWQIGAPSTNITGLANAFTQSGNLASISSGTSQAFAVTNTLNTVTYTTTITPDQAKIYTIADILAYCVNTAGSNTSGGNPCLGLFSDTTPSGSTAPTDTIQVAYYLATNPAGLTMPAHSNAQGSPYYLCSTYVSSSAPFLPTLTCTSTTYPTDWVQDVKWTATNGTATIGTIDAGSVALDASGNIWTSYASSGATGGAVSEFNQAGQMIMTPVTSTTIVGGWYYSACGTACTGTFGLGGGSHTGDALAIDTNGNAWASDWQGSIITNPGNTGTSCTTGVYEGIINEITNVGGTPTVGGYLVGEYPAGVAIDSNNDLYFGDDPINGTVASTSCEARYYMSELSSASPAYSTADFNAGVGRGTAVYYNTIALDENSIAQHAYGFGASAETAIPVMTNGVSTLASVGSTTALPTGVLFGVADASGNLWTSTASVTATATALEYVNVSTSSASPTVTSYAEGTTGSAQGGIYGPQGLAIDGSGNLWVANRPGSSGGGVSEFVPGTNGTSLSALSPAGTGVYGFASNAATWGGTYGLAIDGSGNVWIKTTGGSYMYYLVGVAAPVVTPLSLQFKNSKIGIKP